MSSRTRLLGLAIAAVAFEVIQGDGAIDPHQPDRLSGRTEEKQGQTTRTLTWDLQRR